MKGWVYIISNKAIPGVIKVGFSSKDPKERAAELGTGAPYPYTVEYEALIDNPKQVEKLAHEMLAFVNAGKEWFECDVSVALKAIKKVCENRTIYFEHHSNNNPHAPQAITPQQNHPIAVEVVTSNPATSTKQSTTAFKKKRSLEELNQLVKEGEAEAQYELAMRYDQGDGVKKDLKEAYKLLVMASSQNHIMAHLLAGKAHLLGRGTEKSRELAVPFMLIAASKDNAEAQYHLSELAFMEYLTKKQCNNLKPDVYAFHLMQKSAEQEYLPAYVGMGIHYSLLDNYRQSFEWYKKAAENGDVSGQRYLADLYLEGMGCLRDLKLAFQWFSLAAQGGDKIAKKRIAEWGKYTEMYDN